MVAVIVAGFLTGSIPTATALARLRGIDLMAGGSSNPGANNAWRLGGRRLGASILAVEIGKGVLAVTVGGLLAGPWGAAAAGIAACVGNIVNPWLGFRGGQGLGIAAGILLAGWPVGFVAVLILVAAVARLSRSAHIGALSGATGLVIGTAVDLPTIWGLDGGPLRLLVLGVAVALIPKQVGKLIGRRTR